MKKVSENYNLEACYPAVARDWHPTLNGEITPNKVHPHSSKKYYFLCKCGESYQAAINKRTRKEHPTSCPYCSGKKAGITNCLATTHPHLLEEWNFMENAKLGKTPFNTTAGSNYTVNWICSHCNKPFNAMIAKRAKRNQGCKKCSKGTSFPEQFFCYSLEQIFGEENIFNRVDMEGEEVDIYVRPLRTAIEYCGRAYHKNIERDIEKIKHLLSFSSPLQVIQIRETSCPQLSYEGVSVIHSSYTNSSMEPLREVLVCLIKKLGEIIKEVDEGNAESFNKKAQEFLETLNIREISPLIYARIRTSRKKFVPFISERPDLLLYWDQEKNKQIKPYRLSKSSTIVVNWKCNKGHEWQESIYRQTRKKTICSKCEHPSLSETHPDLASDLVNKSLGNFISYGSEKVVDWHCKTCNLIYSMRVCQKVSGKICPHCFKNTYSLAATHPNIIKEYSTKNEFAPHELTSGSGRKVTWICNLGHEWQARINKRTRRTNPTKCPFCN